MSVAFLPTEWRSCERLYSKLSPISPMICSLYLTCRRRLTYSTTARHSFRLRSTIQSMSSSTRSSIETLGVGDDLPLKAVLDLFALDQLPDVREADVLLEPLVTPLVHGEDDVLDLGHPRLEVALHVLLVGLELRLDVLGHLEVVL